MSTSSSNVYRSNIPPWPFFLRELEARGYQQASDLIRRHLPAECCPVTQDISHYDHRLPRGGKFPEGRPVIRQPSLGIALDDPTKDREITKLGGHRGEPVEKLVANGSPKHGY
jgi:hypothetical protein